MSREIVGTADFGAKFGIATETTITIDNIQSTDSSETFDFDDNDGDQIGFAMNLLPTAFTCGFRYKKTDSTPVSGDMRGVALQFADTDFSKDYVVTEQKKTKEIKGWFSGDITCRANENWDTTSIATPVTPVEPSI